MTNYHAAIRADGEFAPDHAGLGLALFQARRFTAAIEALERAVALELPAAGSLHVLIGRSRQELGDLVGSTAMRRACATDRSAQSTGARPPRHGLRPRAALRGGVGPVSNANRDQPRQTRGLTPTRAPRSITWTACRRRWRALSARLALDPDLEAARTSLAAVRKNLPATVAIRS